MAGEGFQQHIGILGEAGGDRRAGGDITEKKAHAAMLAKTGGSESVA